MKVLLTGCAGFIGSHLAEQLLEKGFDVIGIDNFSKFYNKKVKTDNLSGFINHPNFSFHEVDIRNNKQLNSTLIETVDVVVHLAAEAGVRPSIKNPKDYIDVNISGTQHILQWMLDHDCKKLFFASSSSVYGNNEDGNPFVENKLDVKPISPYAFTKRSAELMNHAYHHLHGIDIINARSFTVYGPRQRPDLAIHKFVDLIYNDQPIQMYGDGSTARDYTFVSDTVEGIMASIDYLNQNNSVFETINLGNQKPIQLKGLIELIYQEMEKPSNILQQEMQEGDVNITYADINKAKSLIRYEPKVSIEQGIKQFIQWYLEKKG
ncbi:MAG: GDP-mannose 4,6-dehydratase [Flavobacteriales bacterium]|nr:GDP-mannose 4,6-dehydratase [Flavobacteriales bacterium]